jgi:hypothetical protein
MTAGGGNQSSTALVLYVWFPQGAEMFLASEESRPRHQRSVPSLPHVKRFAGLEPAFNVFRSSTLHS